MHKINVLAFGSKNFNTSLEELKDHLNFKLTTINENLETKLFENYDVLFCHQDFLKENSLLKALKNSNKIKILASSSNKIKSDIFHAKVSLPLTIKDLNYIIENTRKK